MQSIEWHFTLVLWVKGDAHTVRGRWETHDPRATARTIQAEILQEEIPDLYRDHDGRFNVVDFTAAKAG